ncbi:MAG: hypothetical protein NZ873_01430 [Crenarchaeota archaeon]|nr:hypothetical protein [Thermoproteota archaeon]MDW8033416.1 hypothetical protein [Nitrososphaerota archaeon]
MIVKAALVGSFPRPFKVGRLMSKYRDGKIDEETYEKKLNAELMKIIKKISKDVSMITDCMFLWDDLFEPFSNSFEGLEKGGLYRFLDNNFYYRIPVVKGLIRHMDATLASFEKVRSIVRGLRGKLDIKAVLPGPYTFSKMCDNRYYSSLERLAMDIAEALGEEARELEKNGAEIIEVHEPLLTSEEIDMGLFIDSFKAFSSKFSAKIWLQTYFGPIKTKLEDLSDLRINVLGIDLVEAEEQFDRVLGIKSTWELGLGAINSRSTKLESVSSLRCLIKKTSKKFSKVYLTPNAMMDFIPVSIALAKIRKMGIASRVFKK